MLRYKADRRALVYMVVTTGLLFWQWSRPEFSPLLFTWAAFMAISVTVMSHNHNHLRMWKSRKLNALTDYWLTLFYGFPAFAWIPTHNMNHHKFNNREGDYTITYRVSEKMNLLTLFSYPAVSSYYQQKPIKDYLKTLYRKNRRRFWHSVAQYLLLGLFIGGALLLDWKKALLYIVLPQQIGLTTVLLFNYLQHVHADEESEYSHSRNITGFWLNALLFNNGYHTAHHMSPGTHWSKTPELHAKIEHKIHPSLNEKSMWWFLIRVFLLGPIIPRFRSHSLRLERIERERRQQASPAAA